MIIIVDYGFGNVSSVANMLKKIGHKSIITSDWRDVEKATRLILPGVGSFDYAMNNIRTKNLEEVLNEKVLAQKIPTLGICLGLQLFADASEEGKSKGLSWFSANVIKFPFKRGDVNKMPHMGWNYVTSKKDSPIFSGMDDEKRFYFVHSYYLKANNTADVLATASYGLEFVCALEHENLVGVQFHPEKSHRFGMQLFRNFIEFYN